MWRSIVTAVEKVVFILYPLFAHSADFISHGQPWLIIVCLTFNPNNKQATLHNQICGYLSVDNYQKTTKVPNLAIRDPELMITNNWSNIQKITKLWNCNSKRGTLVNWTADYNSTCPNSRSYDLEKSSYKQRDTAFLRHVSIKNSVTVCLL